MFTDLRKKKSVFDSFRPFSEDFKIAYDNLNLLDLAYMNLKLDGSSLTREGVNEIIKGEMIEHVPLMEHQYVVYHRDVLKTFSNMLEMDMELDEKQIVRLYRSLTGENAVHLRKDGTMLYHLDYMPPNPGEIETALKNIFTQIFKTDFGGDYIKKAISIHNRIIEVYPFDNKNEALARTAMEYELIRNGMPVIAFELSESDYNSILSEYLKTGEYDPLLDNLLSSASKKFDVLLSLLREEDMISV